MTGRDEAIAALRAGRAAVFPTDTVYGLGVAVEYAPSAQEVFDIKRRDAGKPIAWLVGGVEDLQRYGRDVGEAALGLARLHWPGPLTLVVPASAAVPPAYAPQGTIGLRVPDSEEALGIIREVGPLAASSANRAGEAAPCTFEDVDARVLGEAAAFIVGAVPASGTASTVVDATADRLRVLRQGELRIG